VCFDQRSFEAIAFISNQTLAILADTWGYRFVDVIQAVEHWTASTGRNPKRTYVWICSLCVNQHAAFADDNPAEHFQERIYSIGTLLPLLQPWQEPKCVFTFLFCFGRKRASEIDFVARGLTSTQCFQSAPSPIHSPAPSVIRRKTYSILPPF
jgi:hypothetical protein